MKYTNKIPKSLNYEHRSNIVTNRVIQESITINHNKTENKNDRNMKVQTKSPVDKKEYIQRGVRGEKVSTQNIK